MRIVFVCTGNLCRSPMAAAIARDRHPGVEFASAGTWALPGRSMTRFAAQVLAEIGVDPGTHRSAALEQVLTPLPDRVYAMTENHLTELRGRYPSLADRFELFDPEGRSIDDPYGLDLSAYRRVRNRIEAVLDARAPEWQEAT